MFVCGHKFIEKHLQINTPNRGVGNGLSFNFMIKEDLSIFIMIYYCKYTYSCIETEYTSFLQLYYFIFKLRTIIGGILKRREREREGERQEGREEDRNTW